MWHAKGEREGVKLGQGEEAIPVVGRMGTEQSGNKLLRVFYDPSPDARPYRKDADKA